MKLLTSIAAIAGVSVLAAGSTVAGPHGGGGPAPTHMAPAATSAMTSHDTAATTSPISTTQRGPAHITGQPNQTCGSATAPLTPGGAASAPGSAFNPDGKAGTVYAGEQTRNSRNTASVSQYDVACSHQK
jgi:hypothetical protein